MGLGSLGKKIGGGKPRTHSYTPPRGSGGSPSVPYARPKSYNPAPRGPRPVSAPRRTTPAQGRRIEQKAKRRLHREVVRGRRVAEQKRTTREISKVRREAIARKAFAKLAGVELRNLGGPELAARTKWDLFGTAGAVERANFEGHMERLWPKVRSEFGLAKNHPMPKLSFDNSRHENAAGFVILDKPKGKREVHITPRTYYGAALRPSQGDRPSDSARYYRNSTPIHEWAHVFQGKDAHTAKGWAEGGAEAFTRDVIKKMGKSVGDMTRHPYTPYVKAVRQKRGKRWIRKGQFK